jgi:hypothetical protein
MRRRLFAVASSISLLLCLASAGLWVRSYWDVDSVGFTHRRWIFTSDARVANWDAFSSELGCVQGSFFLSADSSRGGSLTGPWMVATMRNQPQGLQIWHRHYREAYTRSQLLDGNIAIGWHENVASVPWPTDKQFPVVSTRLYFFPAWAACLALIQLPLLRVLLTVRKSRRSRRGLCRRCSYSLLTGNTSGVCPECGTPVPKEPAEKSPRTA